MDRQPVSTLIFDYDGTLHDSGRLYAPAFRHMYAQMVADGIAPARGWDDAEINRWLGCTAEEMWREFRPDLPPEQAQKYGRMIGEWENDALRRGEGCLYPGTEETLADLQGKGYHMVVLSNCHPSYLQAHREAFGLDRFFDGFYAAGAYQFQPKEKIFPILAQRHPGPFAVIGDRRHDMEVARVHGLFSVGCRYGYGRQEELLDASCRIDTVTQLQDIF